MPHTLLLVDDEENILKALVRMFRRTEHRVLTAPDGPAALQILGNEPVSLILSDHRMPGMTGAELLQRAREIQPEAIRIILTGYTDIRAAIQAINEGAVYRFLTKPWDDAQLLGTVEEALRDLDLRREHVLLQERVRAQNEELKQLNDTLELKVQERTNELQLSLAEAEQLNQALRKQNLNTVKAFAGLLDLRDPRLGAHCRRVAALVQPLCTRLGVRDPASVQDILIASLLHDLGKISLSDAILVKDTAHLGSTERDEVRRHPVVGEGQLQVVEGLAGIAKLVRHHHENFDGSGYPDGLDGDHIPFGARLIRVLDTYDNLGKGGARRGAEQKLVLEAMDKQVSRSLDGQIFNALLDELEQRKDAYDSSRETRVPIKEVAVGMVLSRDLMTRNGVLLMPKEEQVRENHLEKIRNYCSIYSVEPYAYVYRT